MYFKARKISINFIWGIIVIIPLLLFIFWNNEKYSSQFYELIIWPYNFALWASILGDYMLKGYDADGEQTKVQFGQGFFHGSAIRYKLTIGSMFLYALSIISFGIFIFKLFIK